MQQLCKECKAPVEFHRGEVKWVNGKWEVLSIEEDTAMCESCGWVLVHKEDDRQEYDVMYTITETRVKTVRALSEQEAKDIVKNMEEHELFHSTHIETEDPTVLQVTLAV